MLLLVVLLVLALVIFALGVSTVSASGAWWATRAIGGVALALALFVVLASAVGLYGCVRVARDVRAHEDKVAREVAAGLVKEGTSSLETGAIVNTPGQLALLHAWSLIGLGVHGVSCRS